MLDSLKHKWRDMNTINTICSTAERQANERGQQEVGAEHFVLAALALPDGTARQAFVELGVDPDDFAKAIVRQYGEALASIGLDPELAVEQASAPPVRPKWLYQSHPSTKQLMQSLFDLEKKGLKTRSQPLLGAHVLMAATASHLGVTARALRCLGLEPQALHAAAQRQLAGTAAAHAAES